jgi:hypothetical protein
LKKGGIISKNTKDNIEFAKKINEPGPGAYQLVPMNSVKE